MLPLINLYGIINYSILEINTSKTITYILTNSQGSFTVLLNGHVRSKRGNLARGPRSWLGVTHGPPNNATGPLGDYETHKMVAME